MDPGRIFRDGGPGTDPRFRSPWGQGKRVCKTSRGGLCGCQRSRGKMEPLPRGALHFRGSLSPAHGKTPDPVVISLARLAMDTKGDAGEGRRSRNRSSPRSAADKLLDHVARFFTDVPFAIR